MPSLSSYRYSTKFFIDTLESAVDDVTLPHELNIFVKSRDGHNIPIAQYSGGITGKKITIVVYIHGGGFISGDHTGKFPKLLATLLPELEVISVGYRLAPEYPFPVPLFDCLDVIKHLLDNHIAESIVLIGTSAGACLAASCCQALQNTEYHSRILGQIVYGPALIPECNTNAMLNGPMSYSREVSLWVWNLYTFGNLLDTKEFVCPTEIIYENTTILKSWLSILYADASDLSKFPPTLISVYEMDVCFDDGVVFYDKMRDAGGKVTLINVGPSARHCCELYPWDHNGRKLLIESCVWLYELLQMPSRRSDFLARYPSSYLSSMKPSFMNDLEQLQNDLQNVFVANKSNGTL